MLQLSKSLTIFGAEVFRIGALAPSLQLFMAACIFIAFGHCISVLLKAANQSLIFKLLIGNLLLFLYLYFRTVLSRVLGFGFSTAELYILLAALILISKNFKIVSKNNLPELGIIFLTCWLVSMRELPRLTSLSSDPDLHVFWADMLITNGSIPENLGHWGTSGLQYPAGFAVLNALWSYASLLSPLQIVSVQPVLQTLLAFLLLSSVANHLIQSADKHKLSFLQLYSLALYLIVLPYSYQVNFFHLEGTARTSSLLLISGMCLSFASLFIKTLHSNYLLLISSACAVCLIAIAPIHALYAAPCWLISSIFLMLRSRKIFFASILLSCLIFADPYYQVKSAPVEGSTTGSSVSVTGSVQDGLFDSIKQPLHSIKTAWYSYFTIDFINLNVFQTALLYLLAAVLTSRLLSKRSIKIDIALFLLPTIILICIAFIVIPGFSKFSDHAFYRLIPAYSIHLSQQLIYLWFAFLILLLVAEISKSIRSVYLIPCLALVITATIQLKPAHSNLRFEPRYLLASGMGYPTDNDFIVLKQIEQYSLSILRKYTDLDHASVPKILIVNMPTDTGWEEWLFPYGASRVLYQYSHLPVAFYYGQGQQIFSYANYQQKICKNFDLQWLKQNNIRYLFLPDQLGPVCIRGLEKIKLSSEVLFTSGNSHFYKLF